MVLTCAAEAAQAVRQAAGDDVGLGGGGGVTGVAARGGADRGAGAAGQRRRRRARQVGGHPHVRLVQLQQAEK